MPDNKNAFQQHTWNTGKNFVKIFGLNIGTVMFGAILIYMIFSVILYLTASHMESYQVPSGPLSMNETYTGLSIMTEKCSTGRCWWVCYLLCKRGNQDQCKWSCIQF